MIKQQAIERFNNLDIDELTVNKSKWERVIWPLIKPLVKKYLLALIERIFKDQ